MEDHKQNLEVSVHESRSGIEDHKQDLQVSVHETRSLMVYGGS